MGSRVTSSSLLLGKKNASRMSMISLLTETKIDLPAGHTMFNEDTIRGYVCKIPKLCKLLGVSGPIDAE